MNFIINLIFLSNKRKTPNTIDLRLCWIKSIFGCLGIFTIISGVYFFIISASMFSSRKKTGIPENENKKNCQKCFSEIKNQKSIFCTNCGANLQEIRYPVRSDENSIQDQRVENIQIFPEVISPKGISESGYPQSKTENAIIFPKTTKNKSESIHWAGVGESIQIGDFTIKDPITFWSDGKLRSPEASCIDITLPIWIIDEKNPVYPINDDIQDIPDLPTYKDLTSRQRGNYLLWLSKGKKTDLDEIGYAFIYFYGLERRAIVEKKDYDTILDEVTRLLSRYSSSKLFNQYLNNFIRYIIAGRLNQTDESTIKKYFPSFDELYDNSLMTVLAWHGLKDKKVSWELAYSIANESHKTTKSTILIKAPDLFKKLFEKKFLSSNPEGLEIKSLTHQHRCFYHAMSPTLENVIRLNNVTDVSQPIVLNVPDINSSQFETIFSAWDECIEELKPVSYKLNITEGQITREIYNVLPDLLKKEIEHPDLKAWQNFISSKKPIKGTIIAQISEIATLLGGIDKRETLTSIQCHTITTTAQDIGFILVPDQKVSRTSYKWKDSVAIIPINNTIHTSEKFPQAALIFEMAHTIAASDENVSEIEEIFLHKFISEQFTLNAFEIECLIGLQQVIEIQPPSLSKIGKRLSKHLNPEQKLAIANFLGDIVLLDNKFVKKEQRSLKTVFKALEIDPSVSDELIKKLLIGQIPEEPTSVLKPRKARKGEVIPPQVITPEFSIDKEKLKQTMADTQAVQWILASVFEQEQDEIDVDIESEVKIPKPLDMEEMKPMGIDLPFSPESVSTLDTRYHLILNDIMKLDELSQDDFTNLAKKHNLMPRAVFDEINSWADEEMGDFLLEEDENRIIINFKR